MSNVIAGLDIGTSMVRVVVGEINESGSLAIMGVGTSLSTGLKNGVVRNMEATCRSIRNAIESAVNQSGGDVSKVFVGIGGPHIEGINSKGVAAVTGKGRDNREIGDDDIARSIEQAKAVPIPIDRKMIHVLPRVYTVDGQAGIKDPHNMIGVRLECDIHIITAPIDDLQKVIQCVNRANYEISDMGYSGLASGLATLTSDERNLGSILIDIGSGTTDILVYVDGEPLYTSVMSVAGNHVTNDISIVNHISADVAERIKLEDGCCWTPLLETDEPVVLPGIGGRPPKEISQKSICEIIECRMRELFSDIKKTVDPFISSRQVSGGIVLTGGGSMLPGATELATDVFGLPARLGIPVNMGGLTSEYQSPDFSTALGLVLLEAENYKNVKGNQVYSDSKHDGFFHSVMNYIKDLF